MFLPAWQRPRLAAFLLVTCAALCAHADTWREVKSPHFRVLTDSSEGAARDVAFQFEQMRHVFSVVLQKDDVETGAPLTIVAARDLDTFRLLDPAFGKGKGLQIAGWFQRGWEKQFAGVRLDTWTDRNQIVVYHEYAHSILHANTRWLPLWMDEGLVEFYGYTRFREGKIYLGAPSERAGILRQDTLFSVEQMLTMRSSIESDERRTQVFYAEAWAMVHMMVFGQGMENGAKLFAFLKKIQEKEPQKQAFQEVFGDLKQFDKALSEYVLRLSFPAGVLPSDERIDRKTFSARVLTPAEVSYEIGCVQIGTHQHKSGRAMIEKALELDPKLAGAHEELAYADFENGKDAEAEVEWKKAVALDPTLPRSNYALAMIGKPLGEQSMVELLKTQQALRHVTSLVPKFAPAYVQLALVEWRLGQIQEAFKDARMAEALEPSRAGYRILTGNILLQGKQPALAAEYSRYVAMHWSGPDHDEAVDLWKKIPAESRGSGPDLALDVPAGSTVLRGRLAEFTCPAGPDEKLSLTVQPDDPAAAPLKLTPDKRYLSGWSDTLWWGSDHFSLCHHVKGRAVLAAYSPQPGNAGVLLDLEIRDDWPGPRPTATAGAAAPSASQPAQGAAKPAEAPANP